MLITTLDSENQKNSDYFSIPLVVGGQPIIWFNLEDGNLLLNIVILESNRPILLIDNNEVVFATDIWDIEFVVKRRKSKDYF